MVNGLRTSAAAMLAQSERLAVLSNNLANVNAAGFKAEHLQFFQFLTSPSAVGSVSPTDPAAPLFPPPGQRTHIDFSAGGFRETGNPLDLALEGSGFFVVRSADGPRLTRAGTFTRVRDGLLASADGAPVLDARQEPIRLPDRGSIVVAEDGTITSDGVAVGQLLIVNPPRPERLRPEGGTRFAPPAGMELSPATGPKVRQGALELSNVNPVLTLIEMIDALRVYEAAQRTARGVDETLERAVNDVGRTS